MKCAHRRLLAELLLDIVNTPPWRFLMMRVAKCVPTLMALAFVAGCGGGQTGDLSGKNSKNGENTGSQDGCTDQLQDISLDDSSALGFDARSVLAFAAQSFQADLAWQAVD